MVTKNYNISMQGQSLDECYIQFLEKNKEYLKRIKPNQQIYDLNESAIIIDRIIKKQRNSLTLIGKKENFNKTIKEIKEKGFSLEEIFIF